MKVWAITFTELGSPESIVHDGSRFLVFTDSAYDQAVGEFNEWSNERLSYHTVSVVGEPGPDGKAHLRAFDGDDAVELRPYDVIGG